MSEFQLTAAELEAAKHFSGEGLSLLPHQQRVVDEFGDLCNKIEKLRAFISSEKYFQLCADERILLGSQLIFMDGYASALNQRLGIWGVGL